MMSNGDGAAAKATNAAKSGAQAAKVAANFVPSKEDYQKVRRVCMHKRLVLTRL